MSSPLPDQQGFAVSGHDLADIFRRHYNQLVHVTAPVCLAISCELYTDGWISQTTKNTTASSGLEAANTIVKELETNLKTRLKNDPNPEGAILKLCNCLETSTEAANFKTITQSIREEIEQCKHPDLHKHQSGQHCEPLTTAQRTTQHKPRSRQRQEQHEMEKQYVEEEPKKEEEEAEEEEEENVPKKKEPLLLQKTIKLQAIKKNQEKEKELKEPEDMKYKHIEKDSEDFFLLGLLNSLLKDNKFIEANYSPFFNLNKDSKDDANRTITRDFAVLGERLITIEQTLSALNTHVADRDKTVSATITELSQSVNELKAKFTEGMQETMETMKAMMEEMKKPRFVSHQEFDGLPDLPGPQDGSKRAHVSAETDTIRQLAQHKKERTSTRNLWGCTCEVPYLQDQAAAVGFDPKMTQLDEKLQALTVQAQRVSEAQAADKQQMEEKFREQDRNFQDLKNSAQEGFGYLSEQVKCLSQQARQDNKSLLEKHRRFVSHTTKLHRIEAAKTRAEWQQATYKLMQMAAEEQRWRRDKDFQTLTEMMEKSTTGCQEELLKLRMEIESLKSQLDELKLVHQDMLLQLHKDLDSQTEKMEAAFEHQDEKLMKQLEHELGKHSEQVQQQLKHELGKHSEQVQQAVREEMQRKHDEQPAWLEAFVDKVRNK